MTVRGRSWRTGHGAVAPGMPPPPIQVQTPIQSPAGTANAWGFSQADGGSPPCWLDTERASELSCGRDTGRVLDLYPLPSMRFRHNPELSPPSPPTGQQQPLASKVWFGTFKEGGTSRHLAVAVVNALRNRCY